MSFDSAWLRINKGFTKVLVDWIREKLTGQSDVYFVTELQVGITYIWGYGVCSLASGLTNICAECISSMSGMTHTMFARNKTLMAKYVRNTLLIIVKCNGYTLLQ